MDEEKLRFEIATIVMGLEVRQATADGYKLLNSFDDYVPDEDRPMIYNNSMPWYELPHYSISMSDCWQAVEQMFQTASSETHVKFSEWWEKVQIWTLSEQKAATLICRAILTLYGLQNEKEVDDYSIESYV